jgi:hypothetical protein
MEVRMFLIDKLHEQLPRSLKDSVNQIDTYLLGEPAAVTFKANGQSVKLKVDSEKGLTEEQIARLCVVL